MEFPEKPFLTDLFAELNASGVKYAVLRGSDALPNSFGGSDIDFLTLGDDESERLFKIAEKIADRYHGKCISKYFADSTVSCWAGRHDDGTWWGGHIDVVPVIRLRGIPYINQVFVYEDRHLVNGAYYRCGDLTEIGSFLKEVLLNGKTRKDYYPKALNAYSRSAELFYSSIFTQSGYKIAEMFKQFFVEKRDDVYIRHQSARIVRALRLRMLSRMKVFFLIKVRLADAWYKYRRLIFKPGFSIAVLGTDGSGKTTLIGNIVPVVEKALHSQVHYEHLRPNFLPSLAYLKDRKKEVRKIVTNPHGGKTSGWLSSLLRFAYYYIDYTLGYWVKIFPKLVKRQQLVVFDRYYYEYMIDPKRCAVKLPPGWARFWSWFMPKPDLILCLGGDPEKIYARKPETSLEEVRRQVAALKKFCDGSKRAVWIDTTISIQDSCDLVLGAIFERMSAR